MSFFKHPHITRGIVCTAHGSFVVTRGIVEASDEIGEALGWAPLEDDNEEAAEARKYFARRPEPSSAQAPSRSDAY